MVLPTTMMTTTPTTNCECAEDKFCPRYQRDMVGRFRAICRGDDVDVGTAAAFREQWAREAGATGTPTNGFTPSPILLRTDQMPGDTVVMTAAIYSLHRAHPGKYLTAVESPYPEVFKHNPDVIKSNMWKGRTLQWVQDSNYKILQMHYPAIHQCNDRGIHFMQGWCEHISAALGINVPLLTDRPRLYFPDPDPPTEDYWVVCSGGKQDFTNKLWGWVKYQEVVARCSTIEFIQVGDKVEDQPRLRGTEDMVGKTTLRQLFDLVRRARGVLCGVSLLMHVAAALDKPCVVIAGGREPVAWNAYPKQQYVHTVGVLPCRSVQGHAGRACWRSRTVPLGDGSFYDRDLCERPVDGSPQCMEMIEPEEIARLILRYNDYQ